MYNQGLSATRPTTPPTMAKTATPNSKSKKSPTPGSGGIAELTAELWQTAVNLTPTGR